MPPFSEEASIWDRGQPYVVTGLVTYDGRFVYRHPDTRRMYAYEVQNDQWVLTALPLDEDLFEFEEYLAILSALD